MAAGVEGAAIPGRRLLLVLLVLAVASTGAAGQTRAVPTAATIALDQPIPVDPAITVGTLPNGLRYYVRPNRQPRGRAELRLVVKAGSVLEDDDQRGLAHFVEHMLFNGTRNFPGQEVAGFMQSLGMRFGAHVNAHTGFDETVYELQIPTTDGAAVDRALLVLEDWARHASFEADEIERERGVILEEWRLGLGAEARLQDQQMPVLLQGSRYAARSPIGSPAIIRSASRERLRQFYADWYRPDLMAVIAVGDFDGPAMEAALRARFGAIPAAVAPRPRHDYDVPDHPGTLYAIARDKEVTTTTVGVFHKRPARNQRTADTYRGQMVDRLFAGMLTARLRDLASQPDAPFLAAQTSRGLFVRSTETTTVQAVVPDAGVERALTAMFAEVERVVRYGFTASELDRQKLNSAQNLERALVEKDKSPSGPLADEFVRNFMNDEPIPGIIYEQGLAQRFLPQISLAEVNSLAATWVTEGNRVVVVSAPEKRDVPVPTRTSLAAAISAGRDRALAAYVDAVDSAPLLSPLPAPGTIRRETALADLGITEWELSNRVRVLLLPTTNKQDEILFRAISPGGTSLARTEDDVVARTAADVVAAGGLGALAERDLVKRLAGVTAGVDADIDDTTEGLSGGATRTDLETLFQLIHLTFTAPRGDPEAFAVMQTRLRRLLADQAVEPDAVFNRALIAALTQDHPRARPLRAEQVDDMNLARSIAFYRERFADASDFTFVFVGSFDLPTMKPLVARYLGSLPALYRNERAADLGIRAPTTVVTREVVKGVEPKGQVGLVFTGPFVHTEADRVALNTMGQMLGGNLNQRLREALGGTYGVSVATDFTFAPFEASYRVAITFGCDPARLDDLIASTWAVIDEFKRTGPSPSQVADGRRARRRDLETSLQDNRYLLNRITATYMHGEPVAAVFDADGGVDQLTESRIRDLARLSLNPARYVQVTLRPEAR